jgi:hypothetical protein
VLRIVRALAADRLQRWSRVEEDEEEEGGGGGVGKEEEEEDA